jgi:hypothetical protein
MLRHTPPRAPDGYLSIVVTNLGDSRIIELHSLRVKGGGKLPVPLCEAEK